MSLNKQILKFLRTRTVQDKHSRCSSKKLYDAYLDYCIALELEAVSLQMFTQRVRKATEKSAVAYGTFRFDGTLAKGYLVLRVLDALCPPDELVPTTDRNVGMFLDGSLYVPIEEAVEGHNVQLTRATYDTLKRLHDEEPDELFKSSYSDLCIVLRDLAVTPYKDRGQFREPIRTHTEGLPESAAMLSMMFEGLLP